VYTALNLDSASKSHGANDAATLDEHQDKDRATAFAVVRG